MCVLFLHNVCFLRWCTAETHAGRYIISLGMIIWGGIELFENVDNCDDDGVMEDSNIYVFTMVTTRWSNYGI